MWESSLALNCSVIRRRLLWWWLICLTRHFLQQSTKYPGWGVWVWWRVCVSSWVLLCICRGTHWTWCGLEQNLSLDRSKLEKNISDRFSCNQGIYRIMISVNLNELFSPNYRFYFLLNLDLPNEIQQCNIWIRWVTPSKHASQSSK